MRLIDSDALIEALGLDQHNNGEGMTSDEEWIAEAITTAPTIEAEPVRRGRWRKSKSKDWSGGGAYICSVCGYGYSWAGYHEANEFTYCPNCGAKMEG